MAQERLATTWVGAGAVSPMPRGGTASVTTSGLSAGGHAISAVYNGDGNFSISTSAALSLTGCVKQIEEVLAVVVKPGGATKDQGEAS